MFSDINLKDQDSFKDFKYGLDEVMKLKPIYYNYAEDNELGLDSEKTHVGFVAQDVQKLIPEAVNRNSADFLEINNDPIIWTVLNAVKELAVSFKNKIAEVFVRITSNETAIAELKTENKNLKAENKEFKKRLERLEKIMLKSNNSRMPASEVD